MKNEGRTKKFDVHNERSNWHCACAYTHLPERKSHYCYFLVDRSCSALYTLCDWFSIAGRFPFCFSSSTCGKGFFVKWLTRKKASPTISHEQAEELLKAHNTLFGLMIKSPIGLTREELSVLKSMSDRISEAYLQHTFAESETRLQDMRKLCDEMADAAKKWAEKREI